MTIPFEILMWVHFSIALLIGGLLVIRNVKLKRALKEAESANQVKSDFVLSISHEIRAPMDSILAHSDLLQQSTLEPQQKTYVNSIQANGQLLLSIINDVLDFSKLEAGKANMSNIDFDLEHLVYDIFKVSEVRFRKTNINTYIDWDPKLPHWVKGDPTRLRQVLLNLLGNAAKFTQRGDIGLLVKLDNITMSHVARITFTVTDTGVGIEPKQQAQLQAMFKSSASKPMPSYETARLGLVICKRIVDALGGTMTFQSTLGEGSEFYVTLDFKPGVSLVEQAIQPLSKESLVGKKVVIIDNHQPSLQIMVRHCKEIGLNVVASVHNGPAALDAINRLYQSGILPDLVLSDVVIPGINGFDFAHKIRLINAFKSMRIIAVTSDVRVGAALRAQEKGFDGFLPKPVSRQDLTNIIATVLGDHRPSDAAIVTRHMVKEVELKGLKILVVDDSVGNLQLLKSYLDTFGCVTGYAHNGQEAIEKIQNDSYDLCLMDLDMPFLNGLDAVKQIRAAGFDKLPVVALANQGTAQEQEQCIHAGMNDYLLKPVQIKDLKEKISRLVKQV